MRIYVLVFKNIQDNARVGYKCTMYLHKLPLSKPFPLDCTWYPPLSYEVRRCVATQFPTKAPYEYRTPTVSIHSYIETTLQEN